MRWFLAGALLLVAAGVAWSLVQKTEPPATEAKRVKNTLDVVIAVRDLRVGDPISEKDVVVRAMTPGMAPAEGTFSTLGDVVGRTPRERVLANEPVREERIARPDQGIGLNAIVTPGKRAMTVATSPEDAVAGLLQPGNYVDIIVTIKPESPAAAESKWATDTILEALKVLAVGGAPAGPQPGEAKGGSAAPKDTPARKLKPSITLEVTPEEAEKLALALSQGEIYVVLRSDIDTRPKAAEPAAAPPPS